MVIHHGGAGTTGAGLRSGAPSAAIPFTADQAFWARQISRLGVGPEGFPARRITARRLASLIETTLNGKDYAARALAFAGKLQMEDGVDSALRFVHQRLGLPDPAGMDRE
jgi:UDP:flavonoid glycosyltransferase YjiC (YdhE family)